MKFCRAVLNGPALGKVYSLNMPTRFKPIVGCILLVAGMAMFSFGLFLLVKPAQYAAAARIWIVNDVDDPVALFKADPRQESPWFVFDPYFIQTTFEIIQSQLVLSNVVANLNLDEVWGRKYFKGPPLQTTKTMAMIKHRLKLVPVLNTRLIAITFTSDDRNEAAQVANAVAAAYVDYRINSRQELVKKGLQLLHQQFQDEESQISILHTNVEQLLPKFEIQKDASTNPTPEQQAYWDEKRKLDQLVALHKLLSSKIETEELDLQIPFDCVKIIDMAVPPTLPVGPNRFLGGGLAVGGLLSMFLGWRWLKPSARPAN